MEPESILKGHAVILHNDVPSFVSLPEILKVLYVLHAFHIFKKLQLGFFSLPCLLLNRHNHI